MRSGLKKSGKNTRKNLKSKIYKANMHTPVLLKEAVDGLNVKPGGFYIDATVGEGGHLREITSRGGRVLGVDADEEQIKRLTFNVQRSTNIRLVVGNFADIERLTKENNFYPADGVLFDLGLSMTQIGSSGRGFSFKNRQEPLDMRLSLENETTAAGLVNSLSEDELYELFARNSEELNSRAVAQVVDRAGRMNKILTVGDLTDAINTVVKDDRERVQGRIFQALRMSVNKEIESLKKGLQGATKILRKGGRISAISFHSVEDRLIKRFITENKLKQINKNVIKSKTGKKFERSAKLRVIQV